MIYDIRHLTIYKYDSPVSFSHCALRLLPVDGPGQLLLDSRIVIDPSPIETDARICFFGNRVTSITIDAPHRELKIDARSSVDVDRAVLPDASISSPWEEVRDAAFAASSLAPESPAHFLHPSQFVPRFQPATEYARASFQPRRPSLEAAIELMRRIRADFRYDPKATIVSTTLAEAYEKRRGVCQDFAHIMIAGLRGMGLPAAYISGYLRTVPPEGKARLEGADATHAWVSLWCGPNLGWVGLDPTNSLMMGNDHIVLARGRDYADISPVAGIILGSGEQEIDVKVDVIARAQT